MKKKNDISGDKELEKLLKDKMNELSSTVDCFDRISAKAFPERASDFSDSEFTVSDLENVTGRRRAAPVLKWTAAAAALALCIGVIPNTRLGQEFLANMGSSEENPYRSIISEIKAETEEHTYKVYDMTLSEYSAADVMVTPLYSCPFEAGTADDINVRVFVRSINGIPTNQIYAVEYAGDYSEANFLAAAKSKAEFTDTDIEALGDSLKFGSGSEVLTAVNVFFKDNGGEFVNKQGNIVTVASFDYSHIFKDENETRLLSTQVLYSNEIEAPEVYYYDMITTRYDSETLDFSAVQLPDRTELWECSVNFDGSDAMPEKDSSTFIRADYFNYDPRAEERGFSFSWYEPYTVAAETYADDSLHVLNCEESGVTHSCLAPADSAAKLNMRMYLTYGNYFTYSSQSDPTLDIIIEDTDSRIAIHKDDLKTKYVILSEAEAEREREMAEYAQREREMAEESERYQKTSEEAEIQRQKAEEALRQIFKG